MEPKIERPASVEVGQRWRRTCVGEPTRDILSSIRYTFLGFAPAPTVVADGATTVAAFGEYSSRCFMCGGERDEPGWACGACFEAYPDEWRIRRDAWKAGQRSFVLVPRPGEARGGGQSEPIQVALAVDVPSRRAGKTAAMPPTAPPAREPRREVSADGKTWCDYSRLTDADSFEAWPYRRTQLEPYLWQEHRPRPTLITGSAAQDRITAEDMRLTGRTTDASKVEPYRCAVSDEDLLEDALPMLRRRCLEPYGRAVARLAPPGAAHGWQWTAARR